VQLSYQQAEAIVKAVFMGGGFTPHEAQVCTAEILDAEWRGKSSYGLELVPHVLAWRAEKLGEPEVREEGPASAFVEGNNGLGPVVAAFALDVALKKVAETGVALVGVRNKWPWLTAGYHLRRAADEGFVAATWSAGVSIVAPHGGVRPVFGTNPFGIAVPASGGPVVFDSAITAGPASAMREARQRGRPLPEGTAVDRSGQPTRDPVAARKGALLAFGGHRGSGLAMMIELLGGAWVGAKTGTSRPGPRGFVYFLARHDLFGFFALHDVAEGLVHDVVNASECPLDMHIPGRGPVNFAEAREVDEKLVARLKGLAPAAPAVS
jgi:LDH2 family malate/lactate/ureidoglycolate dehydrogenase